MYENNPGEAYMKITVLRIVSVYLLQ